MNKIITILLVFVSCLAFGQGATPNLRSGIAMYVKYEETSGTAMNDETSNNNDGTGYGGVDLNATGKVNSGISYAGTNDYVSYGNSSSLSSDNSTYSIWVKSNSATNPSDPKGIIYKAPSTGFDQEIGLVFNTNGTIQASGYDGTSKATLSVTTSSDYYDATWHLLTIVKTYVASADILELFVDGESEGSDQEDYNVVQNTNDLESGRLSSASLSARYFLGTMDEFMVYTRALSDLEVKQLYNSDSGLLYVQENFKNNYNYEKLINYVISRQYFTWITGAN
jgi:hypothetical protein